MIPRLVALLLSLALSGCSFPAMLGGEASASGQDVGPSNVGATDSPAETPSMELHAGVVWLWQSVARIQDAINAIEAKTPAVAATLSAELASVREDCLAADTEAQGDDTARARATWRKARVAIGRIAAACLAAAATQGLSKLAASLGEGA